VYATFANNGRKVPLVALRRVVDAQGNVLLDYQVPPGDQVLDPRAAYMISNVLSDPSAKLFTYGRNTPLVLKDRPAASKTGTTDNYRDTWTDGYTPNLAIVVWVGNTDGHPMNQALSTLTAGKIWPAAMQASIDALDLRPDDFVRPDGLEEHQVCGDTAMRPGEPPCRNDLFFAGQAPPTPQATAAPTAQPTPPPEPTAEPTPPPQPTVPPTQAPPQPAQGNPAPANQQPPQPPQPAVKPPAQQPAPQQPAQPQQQAPAAPPQQPAPKPPAPTQVAPKPQAPTQPTAVPKPPAATAPPAKPAGATPAPKP
jgi:membrane peptidoglycan carboxypeptidase